MMLWFLHFSSLFDVLLNVLDDFDIFHPGGSVPYPIKDI
jgi:hypothetical protein